MEARSLGRFIPSSLQSEVIEAEVRPLLPVCCRCERISVRIPQGIVPHPDNLEFHQDGGGSEGTTKHMVVWASEMPTEIEDSNGSQIKFEPFDLIWFDNCKVRHRQPRQTNELTRWFVSVRCSGAIF